MSDETLKSVAADLTPRIAVIGVGGAGGNAVNNMIAAGLEGVTFVVANTDAQALAASEAEKKIQLGVTLTEGLGAGSKPEIGAAAAEEAAEDIRAHIEGCHMVFVAAGMGGGTGTGAAGVIARIAHELDVLTVGVVTKPFHFEGNRRMRSAEAGITELAKHVDTLIAIPNQNLFRVANEKTTFAKAFEMADQVLHAGISCVTDLIVREGLINLDFADVRAIMLDMGAAMMGTGEASGDNRAVEAAELAIANPLLDDVTLKGARGLLVSISGSDDLTLYEVDQAANRIRKEVDPDANIIVGANFDHDLKERIRVSIVASGLRNAASAKPAATATQAPAATPAIQSVSMPIAPKPAVQGQPIAPQRAGNPPVQGQAPQAAQPSAQSQVAPDRQPAQALGPHVRPASHPGANAQSNSGAPAAVSGHQKATPERTVRARKEPEVGSKVEIEVGPPRMLTAGALSRPVTQESEPRSAPMAQAAFMPEAPASVRRAPPRMPDIEDFPPIAQRELRDKDEDAAAIAPPRRRSRLFDRLKGTFNDETVDEVTDLKDIATAIDNPDGVAAQDAEIPGFFKRQVGQ